MKGYMGAAVLVVCLALAAVGQDTDSEATGDEENGDETAPHHDEDPPPEPTDPPPEPTDPPPEPTDPPPEPTDPPPEPTDPPPEPTDPPPEPTEPPPEPTDPPPEPTDPPPEPTDPPHEPTDPPPEPTDPPHEPTDPPPEPTDPPPEPIDPPPEPTDPPHEPTDPPPEPTNPPDDPVTSPPSLDDDSLPPQIHEITAECSIDKMTINIEFNKPYNGIIFSQDFSKNPECVYVRENSNQLKFSFSIVLQMCGTRYFSDFQTEGQAYLENVLVVQNEAGIQEVWDHIRRVRCIKGESLSKLLVSTLTVGMLKEITSHFGNETATASLDIQMGRGPFAPEAHGLIKIGEVMTLVITLTGDPIFDIIVKQCVARDADSTHFINLTDANGCTLRPRLFGAFQKTRETGDTGANVIAYAFFNAFKFPDEMNLIMECDVELCKKDCEMCPNPGSFEPGKRRKRDIIFVGNSTLGEAVTVGKGLRVVFPEDLESPEPQSPMCVSYVSFLWVGAFILFVTVTSSVTAGYFWLKTRKCNQQNCDFY